MLLMWDPLLQKAGMQCAAVCSMELGRLKAESGVVVCLFVTLLALICALNTS